MGYIGVPFFYLLSGYVLTYGYGKALSTGGISNFEFWRRRFFRLFPVLAISLALGFLPLIVGLRKEALSSFDAIAQSMKFLVLNLLGLGAWFPESLRINFPAWSISVEAFFYLLFPFLFVKAQRFRIFSPAVGLVLCWLASCALALSFFGADSEIFSIPGNQPQNWLHGANHYALREFMDVNPFMHFMTFLSGVFLFQIHSSQKINTRAPFLLLASCLSLCLVVQFGDKIPYVLLHVGFLIPIFSALIIASLECQWLRSFLEIRPLVLLGESSFALYMIHVPLRDYFSFVWNHTNARNGPAFPLLISIAMLVVIGASTLLFLRVERPIVLYARAAK